MKGIKNILFDLDGTIIDPKEGIFNSIKYSLIKLKIPIPSDKELECFIGPPLIDSYSSYFNLSKEKSAVVVNFYREYYSTKGVYQNKLYDHIQEVIQLLKHKNYQLFVATSKPTIFAKNIISQFNLNEFFTAVVGSNLDNTRKDKSEIIDFVLKSNQLNPNESIMIGDTKYDILGAKKNKIKSIGVNYGYGSSSELKKEKADYLINSPLELVELF